MLIELALATAIRQSNPAVSEITAQLYAGWVAQEAADHNLDPWIFQEIIHRESRWTPGVVRHESNESCSVGLGQLNGSCAETRVKSLQDPHTNIQHMATFLSAMHESCKKKCDDLGWLRGYNPGNPAYLVAVRKAVKAHHAQDDQPVVLPLPTEVYVPRVSRKSDNRTS